jgi:hypothetical protein
MLMCVNLASDFHGAHFWERSIGLGIPPCVIDILKGLEGLEELRDGIYVTG